MRPVYEVVVIDELADWLSTRSGYCTMTFTWQKTTYRAPLIDCLEVPNSYDME